MKQTLTLLTALRLAPLAAPRKVTPADITIQNVTPTFRHTFPGNSVTVLRLT